MKSCLSARVPGVEEKHFQAFKPANPRSISARMMAPPLRHLGAAPTWLSKAWMVCIRICICPHTWICFCTMAYVSHIIVYVQGQEAEVCISHEWQMPVLTSGSSVRCSGFNPDELDTCCCCWVGKCPVWPLSCDSPGNVVGFWMFQPMMLWLKASRFKVKPLEPSNQTAWHRAAVVSGWQMCNPST